MTPSKIKKTIGTGSFLSNFKRLKGLINRSLFLFLGHSIYKIWSLLQACRGDFFKFRFGKTENFHA